MTKFYLYRLTFPDGLSYIGVSKNPKRRYREHCRKHNEKKISLNILVCGSHEYIYDLEQRAINAFCTLCPQGYNLNIGGLGGREPTPSIRAKLSVAHLGIPHSAEHNAKIGFAHLGVRRYFTAEHRNNLARAATKRVFDQKTKAKMRVSRLTYLREHAAC